MVLQREVLPEKTLIVIAHLSMLLARTGFGLLIPLVIFLNQPTLVGKKYKEELFDILIFQAKITFSFLFLQFLGLIYQIAGSFITAPAFTQLNFSPYNPLLVINLLSQVILTAGIVFAIFGTIFAFSGGRFRYPSLWFSKK